MNIENKWDVAFLWIKPFNDDIVDLRQKSEMFLQQKGLALWFM